MSDLNDHNDDDLKDIFADLKPEDFLAGPDTSAVGISALADMDGEFDGEQGFIRFLARQFHTVRAAYASAEGEVNPIAVMATTGKELVFIPDEDETLGQFAGRLRREAAKLGVVWVFICRKTMVGSAIPEDSDGDEQPVVGDSDVYERARVRGRMRPGMLFYAQRRDSEGVESVHGYAHATDMTTLGDWVVARAEQQLPMFDVLG